MYHESVWVCGLAFEERLSRQGYSVERRLRQALNTLRRSFEFLQSLRTSGGVTEIQISIFAREEFRIELLAEEAASLGRMGVNVAFEVNPATAIGPVEQ